MQSRTNDTAWSRVIRNRVIRSSVTLRTPLAAWALKIGITDPLDPTTFPYRTQANRAGESAA